jgi:hypothetical protein
VLAVAALELRNPVSFVISMKSRDPSVHEVPTCGFDYPVTTRNTPAFPDAASKILNRAAGVIGVGKAVGRK